jgi:catechol 2,3-dioxygenase-like lactoylglutathione lyase family enzyme
MPIDHVGLGVPDVDAALAYYDESMPQVGFVREWETGYRATDWHGAQIFVYPTLEDGDYSRHRIGAPAHLVPRPNPRGCASRP